MCGMNFINLIRIRSIFGIEDQLILSYNPISLCYTYMVLMTVGGKGVIMQEMLIVILNECEGSVPVVRKAVRCHSEYAVYPFRSI